MKKVITYGTFDLFHQGHYNILKRAKALGDYLIVGVTTEHFDEARGKVNVIDDVLTRIENVRATGFADEIIVEDHEGQKIEDIQRYGADIFTVGSDWVGTFDYLKQFCEVVYLPRTPDVSSTALRENKFKIIKMGIVGTGRIAHRYMAESKYVSGIENIAAFNPVDDSLTDFCSEWGVIRETEDYDKFMSLVGAVYIASPNETHYEYAKKALLSGKHVLSEKPLTFTKAEAEELYALAKEKELVLLEAVKAAYCPGFQQLVNIAQSGKIGEIRDIEANFTRIAGEQSRERTDAEYGGGFLEYGSNVLLPIIKILGKGYTDVRFHSLWDENGVDIYNKVEFDYEGAMATAKTGVGVKTEGQLVVSGTKGYILAPSPWWLTRHFEVRYEKEDDEYRAGEGIEVYEPAFRGDGLRYEISEFVMKINGYARNSYKLTAGESIAMADITERYMEYRKREGH